MTKMYYRENGRQQSGDRSEKDTRPGEDRQDKDGQDKGRCNEDEEVEELKDWWNGTTQELPDRRYLVLRMVMRIVGTVPMDGGTVGG